ncbi:zf-HC2 domain-containing protein [Paenibacillus mesophilus]|uniref:anti-sigma factor family protein n=1 Tax=Paenibacillus mesophilus TaxID=2582849 RepID=UPI00110E0165|nr:anti-sigma factor [Paenibacillus mesophilus]TMV45655.1 zf-HC2 domain-containing protein [Paenibacillus mesophilus]
MNCHEVMELMQRDLDLDLNDSEHEAMMAHLQQCPDCAEMFSRLQQLSQELANLPKVAPPFSLVDSILPQLAEIDRAGEGPIKTSAATSVGSDGKAAAVIPLAAERPRRFRTAWLAATGGIVAAGLLLAVFIQDMDGTKVADDAQFMYSTAESRSDTAKSAGAKQKSAAEESAKSADKAEAPRSSALSNSQTGGGSASGTSGTASGGAPTGSTSGSQASKPATEPSQPQTGTMNDQRGTAVQNGKTNAGSTDAAAGQVNKSQVADSNPNAAGAGAGISGSTGSPSSGAVNPFQPELNDTTKKTTPESGSSPSSERFGIAATPAPEPATDSATADTVNKSTGSEQTKAADADKSSESSKGLTELPGAAGLVAVPPTSQLVSEDGLLVAIIDNAKRRIAVTTADGKQTEMFFSATWKEQDKAKLLKWKGSAQLTYSITSTDGKTKTIVVDIAKRTETVQP